MLNCVEVSCSDSGGGGSDNDDGGPYTTDNGGNEGIEGGGGGGPGSTTTSPTTGTLPSPTWIANELNINLTAAQIDYLIDYPNIFDEVRNFLDRNRHSQEAEDFVRAAIDALINNGEVDFDTQTIIRTNFNTDSLTESQKRLFIIAKNELLNNCLGAALLEAVDRANVTMGATSLGEYNPNTNTISFRSNNDINSTTLGAELMHAYQQQLYGTLSDIFNGTNNVGGSNMEFEEKAFNIKKDMLDIDTGMFTYPGEQGLTNWLIDLDINHPTGPIILSQSELDGWFEALEEFQQFHEGNPDHYGDPINYNQNPDAILNLINNVLESDCN